MKMNEPVISFEEFYYDELFSNLKSKAQSRLEPSVFSLVEKLIDEFKLSGDKFIPIEQLAERTGTSEISIFLSDIVEKVSYSEATDLIKDIDSISQALWTLFEDVTQVEGNLEDINEYLSEVSAGKEDEISEEEIEREEIRAMSEEKIEEEVSQEVISETSENGDKVGFSDFYINEAIKRVRYILINDSSPAGFVIGAGFLDRLSAVKNKKKILKDLTNISGAEKFVNTFSDIINESSSITDISSVMEILTPKVDNLTKSLVKIVITAPIEFFEFSQSIKDTASEIVEKKVVEKKEIPAKPEVKVKESEVVPVSTKVEKGISASRGEKIPQIDEKTFKRPAPAQEVDDKQQEIKIRLAKYFRREVSTDLKNINSTLEILRTSLDETAIVSLIENFKNLKELGMIHGYNGVKLIASNVEELLGRVKGSNKILTATSIDRLKEITNLLDKAGDIKNLNIEKDIIGKSSDLINTFDETFGVIEPASQEGLIPVYVEEEKQEEHLVTEEEPLLTIDEFVTQFKNEISEEQLKEFGIVPKKEEIKPEISKIEMPPQEAIKIEEPEITIEDFLREFRNEISAEIINELGLSDLIESISAVVEEEKEIHPVQPIKDESPYDEKKIIAEEESAEIEETTGAGGEFEEQETAFVPEGAESNIEERAEIIAEETKSDQEILSIFRNEASEFISSLDNAFESLDENIHNVEAIKVVQQASHSLKNSAKLLGFDNIYELVSPIEIIANEASDGHFKFSKYALLVISETIQLIKLIIGQEKVSQSAIDANVKKLKDLEKAAVPVEIHPKMEREPDEPIISIGTKREETVTQQQGDEVWVNQLANVLSGVEEEKKVFAEEETQERKIEVEFERPTDVEREKIETKQTTQYDEELISIFNEEANSYLVSLDKALKSLGENTYDMQAIKEVERASHSLKGSAKMLGFEAISQLASPLELLAEKVSNGGIQFSKEMLTVCLDTVKEIKNLLNNKPASNINIKKLAESLMGFVKGEKIIKESIKEKEGTLSKITEEDLLDEIPYLSEGAELEGIGEQALDIPMIETPTKKPVKELAPEEYGAIAEAKIEEPTPISEKPKLKSKYSRKFIEESNQKIEDLENMLVSFESKKPEFEDVKSVYNIVLTLKNLANEEKFSSFSELIGSLEEVIALVYKNKVELSSDILKQMDVTINVLKRLLEETFDEEDTSRRLSGKLKNMVQIRKEMVSGKQADIVEIKGWRPDIQDDSDLEKNIDNLVKGISQIEKEPDKTEVLDQILQNLNKLGNLSIISRVEKIKHLAQFMEDLVQITKEKNIKLDSQISDLLMIVAEEQKKLVSTAEDGM